MLRSRPGERSEELELRDVVPSTSPLGVDGAGELEDDKEVQPTTPPEFETAMRPSGT
jgi:hypothetical protein